MSPPFAARAQVRLLLPPQRVERRVLLALQILTAPSVLPARGEARLVIALPCLARGALVLFEPGAARVDDSSSSPALTALTALTTLAPLAAPAFAASSPEFFAARSHVGVEPVLPLLAHLALLPIQFL